MRVTTDLPLSLQSICDIFICYCCSKSEVILLNRLFSHLNVNNVCTTPTNINLGIGEFSSVLFVANSNLFDISEYLIEH